MKAIFTLYIITAAWQDLRRRSISIWLYIVFGAAGTAALLLSRQTSWSSVLLALLPGCLLLLLTKCSNGAVGSGDGWFFIISALYLEIWSVVALLFYGLICCSICCLGLVVWGRFSKVDMKERKLPFLPFLFPAWLWMGMLR